MIAKSTQFISITIIITRYAYIGRFHPLRDWVIQCMYDLFQDDAFAT